MAKLFGNCKGRDPEMLLRLSKARSASGTHADINTYLALLKREANRLSDQMTRPLAQQIR